MRALLCCFGMLAMGTAEAGTLDRCESRHIMPAEVQLCVETAQLRSTNRLRKLSAETRAAVLARAKDNDEPGLLQEYRLLEARHVRERKSMCRDLPKLDGDACIADMNNAHAAQLRQLAK